jgi:hypothetical protein
VLVARGFALQVQSLSRGRDRQGAANPRRVPRLPRRLVASAPFAGTRARAVAPAQSPSSTSILIKFRRPRRSARRFAARCAAALDIRRSSMRSSPRRPSKAQSEHIFSGLSPIATGARTSAIGRFVPISDPMRCGTLGPGVRLVFLLVSAGSPHSIILGKAKPLSKAVGTCRTLLAASVAAMESAIDVQSSGDCLPTRGYQIRARP